MHKSLRFMVELKHVTLLIPLLLASACHAQELDCESIVNSVNEDLGAGGIDLREAVDLLEEEYEACWLQWNYAETLVYLTWHKGDVYRAEEIVNDWAEYGIDEELVNTLRFWDK